MTVGVPVDHVANVGKPGSDVGSLCRDSPSGPRPVHAEVAEIGERVAERAQLPVEHGDDAARLDVGDAVAEAVVAVRDRNALLHRHVGRQMRRHRVDRRQLARLRLLPLRRPALDLPLDVALAPGEVAEADRVDVGRVQLGEHVDEVIGGRQPAARGVSTLGLGRRVEHDAGDVVHDVERRAVDRDVLHSPSTRGTGTAVRPTAAMIRCSRAMSCAVASTWPSGGRRSTNRRPSAPVTRNVRFERPPVISSNVNGATAPSTWVTSQPVTRSTSTPCTPRP